MIVVHNEGVVALGGKAADIVAAYPASGKFVIKELHGPVARVLDDASLSLAHFLQSRPATMSIVVRKALERWIAPIFMQFKSFELRQELESNLFLG